MVVRCAEKLKLERGDEGYDAALDAAAKRLANKVAVELSALYERHRHVIPGWEKRPLLIH